jgi:arsenite-transporting ATPase
MTKEDLGRNGKTRVLMFSGKGGVGKTTVAASTALHHATQGNRTLAISTDATPSLAHIYETLRDGNGPTKVTETLCFDELGIQQIKEMWDRKFGKEMHEVFSTFVSIEYPEFVDFMTSVLPGLADEFMLDYIRELALERSYDTIIWDTAPLGQTLALLETPGLLSQHLRMAPRIYSRLRVGSRSRTPILEILRGWERLSEANMEFLKRDVTLTLVTIPEALAVQQLDSVISELGRYGIPVGRMVVNHVVKADGSEFLATKTQQQAVYLDLVRRQYGAMDLVEIPDYPREVKGLERLEAVAGALFGQSEHGA